MKQRKWTADERLAIVLKDLKEKKSITDICRELKLSDLGWRKWRDKFLKGE